MKESLPWNSFHQTYVLQLFFLIESKFITSWSCILSGVQLEQVLVCGVSNSVPYSHVLSYHEFLLSALVTDYILKSGGKIQDTKTYHFGLE